MKDLVSPKPKTVDHRTRLPCSAASEVTEPVSQTKIAAHIINIGRHGCFVDSNRVFPAETRVNLSIRYAGLHFETFATVTHSLSGTGMGLNFADLAADAETTLQKWMAEVSGRCLEADEGEGNADEVEFISPSSLNNTASVRDYPAAVGCPAPHFHMWRDIRLVILTTLVVCLIGWLIFRFWLFRLFLR